MLHVLDFQQELFGENGDVGLFHAGGVEDVDHLLGDQRLVDDLADGGFHLLIGPPAAGAVELDQARFDGLEEGDLIFDVQRLFVGDGDGKGLREGGDFVDVAPSAIFQPQDDDLRRPG